MKNYLTLILLASFFSGKSQEEKIVRFQAMNVDLPHQRFTISGNGLLTNLTAKAVPGIYPETVAISAEVNDDNSFIVYTKKRVNELLENQKKYLSEQTDSLKVLLKILVDSLPKQTFVITVQEQIQESTIDKLRKEDIAPQNQEIALLKEEIVLLKKEMEELKRKPRN